MWVLRPLLGLGRIEIRKFLFESGVSYWIEDPSNSDTRFERVRVRTRLRDEEAASTGHDGSDIASARFELSGRAANFIDAHCHVDANDLVWLQYSADDAPDVATAALEALIDWRGGASHPLDRRGKATLAAFLGNDECRAISLGRTLIRRRGEFLTLRREGRDLFELVLEPGACGVWDRRFRIQNLSSNSVLTVSAGGNDGVMPCFSRDRGKWSGDMGVEDGVVGGFVCRQLAGRNSHILPVHQLPLAQALARLAKLKPFPVCPWPGCIDVSAGLL